MSSPVKFSIDYPENLSRGKLLLKTFFGWLYVCIPHGIVLAILKIIALFITFISWWIILFTGKYPENMFRFVEKIMAWAFRVGVYMSLMTDEYPPFSLDVQNSPVKFSIDYPENLSRGKLLLKTFFGWLYVCIPHGIILSLYSIAASIALFISWWIILFTGKYPEGIFRFIEGYYRWAIRVNVYMVLMTDKYPSFSKE